MDCPHLPHACAPYYKVFCGSNSSVLMALLPFFAWHEGKSLSKKNVSLINDWCLGICLRHLNPLLSDMCACAMQAHVAGAEAYLIWSELIPDAFDSGCYKWSGDDHQQQLCMLDNLSHIRAGSQPIWRLVPLQHQGVYAWHARLVSV